MVALREIAAGEPERQSEVDPHEGPGPRQVENRGHLVAFPEGRSHRTEGRAATSARTSQSHRGGSLSQGRGRARRLGLRGSRTKLLGSGSASAEPTTCFVDAIFESMPQALKRGRMPHRRHHCSGRTHPRACGARRRSCRRRLLLLPDAEPSWGDGGNALRFGHSRTYQPFSAMQPSKIAWRSGGQSLASTASLRQIR